MDIIDLKAAITADGSSYFDAMRKVASTSSNTGKQIQQDSKKSAISMDKVGAAGSRMHGAIRSVASYVGLAGMAFGMKDVVEAGMGMQNRLTQLQGTMKNLGLYSKGAFDQLQKGAEGLSEHGGFGVSSQITGLQRFITLTGSVSLAQRANVAATNLARRSHLQYSQAVQFVSQGLTGSIGRLKKYIGVVEPVTTSVKKLTESHGLNMLALREQAKSMGKAGSMWLSQQVLLHGVTSQEMAAAKAADAHATGLAALARIQQVAGGATQQFSKTNQGAISDLNQSFRNVEETVGLGLQPILAKLFGFLLRHKTTLIIVTGALSALAIMVYTVKAAQATWNATMAIGTAAMKVWNLLTGASTAATAAQAGALEGSTLAMTAATASTSALEAATAGATVATDAAATSCGVLAIAMDAIPIVAIIMGLIALSVGIYELIKHWKAVEHATVGAVMTILGWVKNHWPLMLAILGGPFTLIPYLVVKNFDKIKSFAMDVVDWFKHHWKDMLESILAGPFLALPVMAAKHFGQLQHLAGSVGNSAEHGFGLWAHGGIATHAGAHFTTRPAHFAVGGVAGILGGYGGGDSIPAYLEPGEGIMRKESVQGIGVNAFNAINATGQLPPSRDESVYVAAPIRMVLGQRVVAEQTVHFVARRGALNGDLVLQ